MIFILRCTVVAGYYGIKLVVCVSVRPYFRFRTRVNANGFSPNLVCALILWRSDLELLLGKFRQFLTEVYARDTSVFSFPEDNFSKSWKDFNQTWCVHCYCGDLILDC